MVGVVGSNPIAPTTFPVDLVVIWARLDENEVRQNRWERF
jgi:hypothetical protein